METNHISALNSYNYTSNRGFLDASSSDRAEDVLADSLDQNVMSKELLYIVVVITVVGPAQYRAYEERVCTGTLIRKNLVLTLASCLLTDNFHKPDTEITNVYERPNRHRLQVLKIFIKREFYSEDKYESRSNDFGLIMVEKSKIISYPQLPQRLDDYRDIRNSCVMGGYGHTDGASTIFKINYLNETGTHIFSGGACNEVKTLCLHFKHIMPCRADYGAPMICNGTLYALYAPRHMYNSFPTKCFDVYLTTFLPVFNAMEFVNQVINAPIAKMDWLNNPLYILLLCVLLFILMGGIYFSLVGVVQRFFDPAPTESLQTESHHTATDLISQDDSWYSLNRSRRTHTVVSS